MMDVKPLTRSEVVVKNKKIGDVLGKWNVIC